MVFIDILFSIPLHCGFEHTIELEEGSKFVITTPHHHPKKFKDELKDGLGAPWQRMDWPNYCPFVLSILLVKEDVSLRTCMDYYALIKKTIKNRYPIPKLDELLDKLHGVVFFSKLDYPFGYHEIYTREKDMEKTTFYCHYRHYELLDVPSGLTNAPTTF